MCKRPESGSFYRLKPGKASGPDRIPNRVLKELADELAPPLSALFNQSLESGCIPDDWSKAYVSPVFKKGNVHEASNYRPVSLTCVACKLLEHVICSHVLKYLDKQHLLSDYQHGFRKGHSCESQILITLDDLYCSFDKRNQVDVGVLDFSRAFDTVPHMRLMSKLSSLGIVGPIQKWIQAFLTGRTMSVVVDGEESESAGVLSGVPQGTVLGPLLFLIYINDMPNVISSDTYIRLFADDCLIYRDISSLDDQVILQRDLVALQGWAERWGMRFNPSKCNILHIHRGDRHLPYLYDFCGCVLQVVSSAKYLGVTISDNLEWHDQVSKVAKKANTSLHFISRNLKHCPRKARETAYCTITRSSLEYCYSIWDPRLQKDKDTLEKVNRQGVRMVFNKTWRDSSVSPTQLMKELKWLPLETRRYHQRMSLMYKISYNLVAVPPTQLVKPRRNTRGHKFKYQTIGANSNQYQNSFYPRSIPQWNKLSSDTVEAPTIDSFRARLVKP